MEEVQWSPLPKPKKQSKFYSLRSVAFQRPQPKAAAGIVQLPRLPPPGQEPPGSARGRRAPQSARVTREVAPDEQAVQAEEEEHLAIGKLLRRRDKAVEEHGRLEEQIRRAGEKMPVDEELRAEAEAQAVTQERLVQRVAEKLKLELNHIQAQAAMLRDLRRQLNEKDPDKKPKGWPLPTGQPIWKNAGLGGGWDNAPRRSTSPTKSQIAAKAQDTDGQVESAKLNETLQNIVADLRQVTEAIGEDTAQAAPANPEPSRPQTGLSSAFEDAEIDVLRAGNSSVVRLRHPRGAEALLDLQGGHVCSWKLCDSRSALPGSVPLLWPAFLEDGSQGWLWRLAVLDDSNNEPSMTVSCGGDGVSSWLVRRTLTVEATGFKEALYVENLSDSEASFDVSEVAPSEALTSLSSELGHQADSGTFAPKRLTTFTTEPESWPVKVNIAPGSSWSASRAWCAE